MAERPSAIAWGESAQTALVRDVAAAVGLEIVAAGGPTPADATALSAALDVPRLDDLRQAIQRDGLDLLWLAGPGGVGEDERRLIRDIGLTAVTTTPIPGAVADVVADPDEPDTATFVPLMRRGAGFRDAFDALDAFGEIACMSVEVRSRPAEGPLFARLFDAMDLIHHVLGGVESVHAALSSPLRVPESLPGLRGHMVASLRLAENRVAAVVASDSAGGWSRSITLHGPGGVLRAGDDAFEWMDAGGSIVDRGGAGAPTPVAALVAEQIMHRLARRTDLGPPPDAARVLALCEAARLSARTAQAESPARLLEVLSRT